MPVPPAPVVAEAGPGVAGASAVAVGAGGGAGAGVLPNRAITSARPSLLVSRKATMSGRGGTVSREGLPPLVVLTYTVPLRATTTCRARAMLSAKIVVQNPVGRDNPGLSPAQAEVSDLAASWLGALAGDPFRTEVPDESVEFAASLVAQASRALTPRSNAAAGCAAERSKREAGSDIAPLVPVGMHLAMQNPVR